MGEAGSHDTYLRLGQELTRQLRPFKEALRPNHGQHGLNQNILQVAQTGALLGVGLASPITTFPHHSHILY